MSITNTITKMFVAVVVTLVAVGMSFSFAFAAPSVQEVLELREAGFSTSEIVAMFGGASSSTSCTTLGNTQGAVGIQQAVNQIGYSPALKADGALGPLSRAGIRWAQGVIGTPADGQWGPLTQASYQAWLANNCSDIEDDQDDEEDDSDSSDLSGGAGDITLSAVSEFSGEEVGEGQDDVEIMAVDIEADDDSDVEINSVKLEFFQSTAADEDKLYKYAQDVSVWFDGEKVGEADADDFSETNDYWSKSISLDDVIIRAGEEEQLTFAISALNSLDSGDIDTDAWVIDLLSVRFTDGDGVVTTTTADTAQVAAAGTYGKEFDFATFATANDAELELSLGDDDINDANVLDADDSMDTDHEILSFILDASGDSDIWVDEIPVDITTTGQTDESVIVISAWLEVDGDKVSGKEDVPAGGDVTFDDLDYTIDAGDEVEFVLNVEVQDVEGALDDTDTIQASVVVASIDAEDEAGDSITATGAALADAHTFFDKGIQVEFVDATYEKTTSDTTGINETVQFTLEFDVTAFGDDMYVEDTCVTEDSGADVDAVEVYLEGDVNFDNTTCSDVSSTGDLDTGTWEVREGQTERFTVVYIGNGGEAGGAGSPVTFLARIAGIGYTSGAAGTGDTVYNYDLTNFKSSAVTVYDR